MLFRAPYGNNPGAASSMVDLAAPRRLSISSLRRVSSNLNLKGGKLAISSPIGPPVLIGDDRPGTAGGSPRKNGWVNPLDVQFGRDMTLGSPLTPKEISPTAKSPLSQLSQFDFGVSKQTGLPSPPPSLKSSDTGLSVSTTRAPTSLRRVDTAESYANSPEDAPIRSPWTRRETMTFHSPRRKSFSKNLDQRDKDGQKKKRQTEGFEGNFSAFNFSATEEAIPLPDRPVSPKSSLGDTLKSAPQIEAAPKSPAFLEAVQKREVSDFLRSASRTPSYVDDDPPIKIPMSKPSDPPTSSLPQIPKKNPRRTPSIESIAAVFRPRMDSDTRAPGTPTALRAPPGERTPPRGRSMHKLDRGRSSERFDAPPRLDPDRRSQSPLRSKVLLEGEFPVSRGLPRGRRPPPVEITTSPTAVAAPQRPPRENEGLSLPPWADRAERHLSALPAPLTPLSSNSFIGDKDLSPWVSSTTSPTSPIAPRLPSPTFPSLEMAIISSSEDLAKTFELALREESAKSPLASPGMRVTMDKAPPRPGPITLPPGVGGGVSGTPSLKSPGEFSPGFI